MTKNDSFPEREIKSCPATVTFGDCPIGQVGDTKTWLESQMQKYGFEFLLAHAEDGVIWGKIDEGNGRLVLSGEVWNDGIRLDKVRLQQLRLFSDVGELMIWRDELGNWQERLILDGNNDQPDFTDAIDEPQMLWGTYTEPLDGGFTLMSEGQGLWHAVPLVIDGEFRAQTRPLRLLVRHYLEDDDNPDTNTGFTRIGLSRLVKVFAI